MIEVPMNCIYASVNWLFEDIVQAVFKLDLQVRSYLFGENTRRSNWYEWSWILFVYKEIQMHLVCDLVLLQKTAFLRTHLLQPINYRFENFIPIRPEMNAATY
jgi:hypothetical protein